ncbi:hypothetical protein SAMN00120144_3120 [Hymenobacter roseosalivarius DSM 11622]|uniref:Mobilization protein n=1 Tax=Hymenobacter roseosalivarius DSM 11622 TaxID=645990 RepID=A0A1W1UE59_9BACT|nr:DUF5712 family protein [Hymenobacter roseosalivarius]SMB79367.1 hypothetical protein SAMN00120144_3120 [Hymenobacter roseosalivarius DSM 11622]
MYVKLINPATHGKAAYNNSGSSAQTLNYLKQEAGRDGEEASFFGADHDDLSAVELMQNIDSNVKGLRASEAKFYSLVLSPSESELLHIGNDEAKLKDYTRQVMAQYAANFQLKDGRQLGSQEVVWGATLHQQRSYRGTDPEVSSGKVKIGEQRPGLQTHIHVIVSARDAEQKITLNPGGRRNRFDLMKWQAAAGQQFEKQFGYTAQAHEKLRPKQRDTSRDAGRAAKIGERVTALNLRATKEERLDPQRVQQIAQGREYDKTFYRSLATVERRAQLGQPIDNAYHLLSTGRERPEPQRAASAMLQAVQQAVQSNTGREEKTEHISEKRGRNSAELDIEM